MMIPAVNIIIRLLDIIAIRFKCCDKYYPCYQCHEETADHPAQMWNKDEWDTMAILCGVCKTEMTIRNICDPEIVVRIVKLLSILIAVNTIICTSSFRRIGYLSYNCAILPPLWVIPIIIGSDSLFNDEPNNEHFASLSAGCASQQKLIVVIKSSS